MSYGQARSIAGAIVNSLSSADRAVINGLDDDEIDVIEGAIATAYTAGAKGARCSGIDAAIEAIEARIANAQGAMVEHSAADYRAAVAVVVPNLLSCLRKLAAETRKAEPTNIAVDGAA